jgi:hypothetical protein
MNQTIHYCYKKDTGEFMGSGTPFYDTEEIGCTTVSSPNYDHDKNELPYWENDAWVIKIKE